MYRSAGSVHVETSPDFFLESGRVIFNMSVLQISEPLQGTFEEWLEIEPSERLELFFAALDLQPYATKLRNSSPQGAKPINREAILRALLAAPRWKVCQRLLGCINA